MRLKMLLPLLVLPTVAAAQANDPQYVPGATWEHRSPAQMGVDSVALAAAIAFAIANDASAPRRPCRRPT